MAKPTVTYELDGALAYVLDTALADFAARLRDEPNHAPEWSARMAGLADEARRQASDAFDAVGDPVVVYTVPPSSDGAAVAVGPVHGPAEAEQLTADLKTAGYYTGATARFMTAAAFRRQAEKDRGDAPTQPKPAPDPAAKAFTLLRDLETAVEKLELPDARRVMNNVSSFEADWWGSNGG